MKDFGLPGIDSALELVLKIKFFRIKKFSYRLIFRKSSYLESVLYFGLPMIDSVLELALNVKFL